MISFTMAASGTLSIQGIKYRNISDRSIGTTYSGAVTFKLYKNGVYSDQYAAGYIGGYVVGDFTTQINNFVPGNIYTLWILDDTTGRLEFKLKGSSATPFVIAG